MVNNQCLEHINLADLNYSKPISLVRSGLVVAQIMAAEPFVATEPFMVTEPFKVTVVGL